MYMYHMKRPSWKTVDMVVKASKSERQFSASRSRHNGCVKYVFQVFKEITIQGLSHLTYIGRHPLEHVFWVVALCSCLGCTATLCMSTYRRWRNNPTVISIERDSQNWNISYPSIFLCPENKFDEVKLNTVAQRLSKENNVNETIMKEYLKALANLTYDTMNSMKPFEKEKNLPQTGLLNIVREIKFEFNYRLDSQGTNNPFGKKVIEIITEVGTCYAHNSIVSPSLSFENISLQEILSYTPVASTEIVPFIIELLQLSSGFKVYFLPPFEIPDTLTTGKDIPFKKKAIYTFGASPLYSTEAVRLLDVDHRKCRFLTESNLYLSSVYSFNLCQMQCRKELAEKLCNCAPYFYGVKTKFKECDIKGMLCLAENSELLSNPIRFTKSRDDLPKCNCYQSCNADNFVVASENIEEASYFFGNTGLRWGLVSFPSIRFKKDILFSGINLLESFGGTVSLFLGASLLSFIEILYYCTIHLFFYMRKNKMMSRLRKKSVPLFKKFNLI